MKKGILWSVLAIMLLAGGNIVADSETQKVPVPKALTKAVVPTDMLKALEEDLKFLKKKVTEAEKKLFSYMMNHSILTVENGEAMSEVEAHFVLEKYRMGKEGAEAEIDRATSQKKLQNLELQRDNLMVVERAWFQKMSKRGAELRRLQSELARYEATYEEVAQEYHNAMMSKLLKSRSIKPEQQ